MGVSATIVGFAVVIISSFFFLFNVLLRKRNNAGRLPPGPSPIPIIGNLHQMGSLPHRVLEKHAKQFGPIMCMRLGSVPTVVVSSSEAAKEFLKTHDLIFANRPQCSAGKYIGYNYKDIIFADYGAHWRNMRKLCLLELLTPKKIQSFEGVRMEQVLNMITCIAEESKQGRVTVNLSKSISSFTSDTIWQILVGRKLSDKDLAGSSTSIGFKGLIEEISASTGTLNIGDFIPCLDWLDLQGVKRRLNKAHKLFDGVAEKVIDEHLERRRDAEKEKGSCKDLVDVLLDMNMNDTARGIHITRQDMKAIIFDMFAAGMETSATTLEWAMSELLRNPCVLKKLQQELESIIGKDRTVTESDLPSVEYLDCVVKETLRLHPPVPLLMPHESRESCIVKADDGGSYFIPSKTRLLVNAWAIGRDRKVWEDPLSFKPERFMGKNYDVMKDTEMTMIPFGAGRRGCPGAYMGLASVEIALAQLSHCFDWRIEGDPHELEMEEKFGVSIPRKSNLFALPLLRVPLQ